MGVRGTPRPGTWVAGQRLGRPGQLTQRKKGLFRKRGPALWAGPPAPGMWLGLLGNQGDALSAFQQAPLLSFHCFAQFTALAPGPGWRWAGRLASSATGLVPGKHPLSPQLVLSQGSLGQGCRTTLIRPASYWWPSPVSETAG